MSSLRRMPLLAGILLALAALALYLPVRHFQFVGVDDVTYTADNAHLYTGVKLENVAWALRTPYAGNWIPVAYLSHMLDCQLFGLQPGPPHLENALLHAANVLLLFLLLRATTGSLWRSLLVAALFGVHPLNVETVAWVAERKSLLSALFSLLTIAAYGWYARQPGWRRYSAVVALFALALMAKPMAVTLPIVLLLLDYWPLNRLGPAADRKRWSSLALEKLPLLAMSAADSIITVAAQRSGHSIGGGGLALQPGTAVVATAAYLKKTLWPHPLSAYYPHPEQALPTLQLLGSASLLIIITAVVLYLLRARRIRFLAVGWLLYLIQLIPVSGILKYGHILMADRYFYMPGIGLFIMAAWSLGDLVGSNRSRKFIAAGAAICLLLALSAVAANYLQYWKDGVALYGHAASVEPADFVIEEYLGHALATAGRIDEAVPHFAKSCQLKPDFATCHLHLALGYSMQGRYTEALQEYRLGVRYADDTKIALECFLNAGRVEMILGDMQSAKAMVSSALRIDPANAAAQSMRQALQRRGDW
jgi:tetratricopeptide (TPR) repeat protein